MHRRQPGTPPTSGRSSDTLGCPSTVITGSSSGIVAPLVLGARSTAERRRCDVVRRRSNTTDTLRATCAETEAVTFRAARRLLGSSREHLIDIPGPAGG